eukprot:COSAG05_NODE_4711_length_1401_cov_16.055300_3_plen_158_part_00
MAVPALAARLPLLRGRCASHPGGSSAAFVWRRWLSTAASPTIGSAEVTAVAQRLSDGSARYIDCRSEEEFAQGTVPGSINMPFPHTGGQAVEPADFLADVEAEFERSEPIMLGCRSGVRSLLAADVLTNAGYADVSNVEGGFLAWDAAGLPVEPFTG